MISHHLIMIVSPSFNIDRIPIRYRRALQEHPGCPAEVRVGIAACQLKLGNISAAQAAFERTLVLDPTNADAHLGLAIIKLNSSNLQQVRFPKYISFPCVVMNICEHGCALNI